MRWLSACNRLSRDQTDWSSLMGKIIDRTGQRFGRLVALELAASNSPRQSRWLCQCDCGNVVAVRTGDLVSGKSKSCGCVAKKQDGKSVDPKYKQTYESWLNARSRCCNPKHKSYFRYGGRGIVMCDSWKGSFDAFLEDMGVKPTPGHTLERICGNGNYEPGNCVWATRAEQARNKSNNIWVMYNGERTLASDVARLLGIAHDVLYSRIRRGWPESRWFEPSKRAKLKEEQRQ